VIKDKTVPILIVLAVLIAAMVLLGKERHKNPLSVLVVIGLFVYAFGAFGRWIGNKIEAPGLVSFFGGGK
jgi:hypothetical protein